MVIRIAMMGYAHVHAPSYTEQLLRRKREVGDVEIIGVYDENEERGRYYAERYGLRMFRSIDEALKEDPDIFVINTETSKHSAYVEIAAENNVNVFCEKPIGLDLKDALNIRSIVRRSGIKFTTGFNARFNPENIKTKELISTGEIGRVSMVRIRVAHSAAVDRGFRGWSEWFTIREHAGGGGFLDLGIHGADLLRFILADEAVEAVGFIGNFTSSYDIDDQGAGIVRFSKGTIGILDSGWTQVLEGMPWAPLEVYGEKGTIIRTQLGLMYYTRAQGGWVRPNLGRIARNALDELIEAVKKGGEVSITVDDRRR